MNEENNGPSPKAEYIQKTNSVLVTLIEATEPSSTFGYGKKRCVDTEVVKINKCLSIFVDKYGNIHKLEIFLSNLPKCQDGKTLLEDIEKALKDNPQEIKIPKPPYSPINIRPRCYVCGRENLNDHICHHPHCPSRVTYC